MVGGRFASDSVIRGALILAAFAVLCACGQAAPPTAGAGARPASQNVAGQTLLYVAAHYTSGGGVVEMLTYPKGRLVGTLNGVDRPPESLCSDSAGNVYVTALLFGSHSPIYEFAHGGNTPINTLEDPGFSVGCSVDPTTGDVAVANSQFPGSNGFVAIFHPGNNNPKLYASPSIKSFGGCSFDGNGDLLATILDRRDQNGLVMLRHGESKFTRLTLNKQLNEAGPVQWDGRYFAVGYVLPHKIYQVAVSGSAATVVKTIRLGYRDYRIDNEFWIQNKTIVAVVGPLSSGESAVGVWNYPQGGTATKILKRTQGNLYFTGVTLSAAPVH